jgi:hypothetical protein
MKTGGNRRLPGSYERKEHGSRRVNKIQWGVEKERCNMKTAEETGDSQVKTRKRNIASKEWQETVRGRKREMQYENRRK